jgi:hypothetical protein
MRVRSAAIVEVFFGGTEALMRKTVPELIALKFGSRATGSAGPQLFRK